MEASLVCERSKAAQSDTQGVPWALGIYVGAAGLQDKDLQMVLVMVAREAVTAGRDEGYAPPALPAVPLIHAGLLLPLQAL